MLVKKKEEQTSVAQTNKQTTSRGERKKHRETERQRQRET
jgi:hypothetical protein